VKRAAAALALAAGVTLAVNSAQAAHPGGLDPSFGTGGKVATSITPGYDELDGMVLQPDGKIVAGGYVAPTSSTAAFGLARYNRNGSLDTSFGSGGKVTTSVGSGNSWINAVALQADGKIVGAGRTVEGSTPVFALARYNPDGSLDTAFGTGGETTTAIGTYATAEDVAVQPDGKIVAAGFAISGNETFAVVRYNPNGSLDTSFGTGGKVTTGFGPGGYSVAFGCALQPDGKILVAGYAYDGTKYYFALARYNADSSLDTSFGTGGKVLTSIGSGYAVGKKVKLMPDGKIVVAGYSQRGTMPTNDFTLARYDSNGSLDASFGTGGTVTTTFGADTRSAVNAVLIQKNGKIVAVGWERPTTGYRDLFAVARYSKNGLLDSTFGTGGKLTTALGTIDDYGDAAVLQPDGKIVAGGATTKTPDYVDSDFGLVRYQGDTCKVPKLKGKKLKAAKRLIVRHTCKVGKVKKRFSKKVKKGRVLKQRPAAGTNVASATPVNLVVSKGRKR
jgi:uncharacterized delta-60 repeat protein